MVQISAFQSLHNNRTHLDSLNPGLRGAEVAARARVRLLTPSPTGGSQTSAMSIFDNKRCEIREEGLHRPVPE